MPGPTRLRLALASFLAILTVLAVAAPASATATAAHEGEDMLPGSVVYHGTASAQSDCCGVTWSGGKQLLFRGNAPSIEGSSSFQKWIGLPSTDAGGYRVTAVFTTGPDYGVIELVFGGHGGLYFDAYSPTVSVKTVTWDPVGIFNWKPVAPWPGGTRFEMHVRSKNAASTNYYAGLDKLTLTLP